MRSEIPTKMLIKGPFEFLEHFTKILHRLTNTANVLDMQRLKGTKVNTAELGRRKSVLKK